MAGNITRHISHIKSSGSTRPTSSQIIYGEIAVGYGKGNEALFIKNSDNEIIQFDPTADIIGDIGKREISKVTGDSIMSGSTLSAVADSGRTITINHASGSAQSGFKKLESDSYGHITGGSDVTTDDLVGKGALSGVTNGTGISVSAKANGSQSISLATTGTAGTYKQVVVDSYGRVTSGNTADTDTYREIKVDGTTFLASDTTTPLNLSGGTNVTLTTGSTGLVTITATDTTYTPATSVTSIATAKTVGTSVTYAREDHVHDISVETGDNNGQVKIAGKNVDVKGLGGAAYLNTGTTAGTVAAGDHTHANMVTGTGLTSNAIVLGGGSSSIKTSSKTIETELTSTSDETLPTSKAVADYVGLQMASALTYKGTAPTTLPSNPKTGDLYVVATAGTYAGQACEVGDYIICRTGGASPVWDVINGENQVENSGVTLSWGATSTIAKVDGTSITVGLPDNPNTDSATTLNGHYTPSSSATISKTASSSTDATWGTSDFITGITLYKDAKGHITDMAVQSLQMPSNPDTNYYISGATTTTAASQFSVSLSGNNTAAKASFTIPSATTTAAGVMTAADKTLLNRLSEDVDDLSGQSETIAAAINDLNDRKLDASAFTDEHVTSVANHYTPSSSATISKTASSSTDATWGSSDFVTGITLYKDAAGHITDMAVQSLQLPTPTTPSGYDLNFSNSGGATVDTYKPLTSPAKTLKAGSSINMTASSNVITFDLGDIECGDYA